MGETGENIDRPIRKNGHTKRKTEGVPDGFIGENGPADRAFVPAFSALDFCRKMPEHVGRENYPFFVQDAAKALKPGGLFLLHFISSVTEHAGDPWIKRYIFPGGVIPSLREMISAMGDEGFHVLDVENLRLHYNKTLLCWEKNYREHLDQVREMFDERFVRMWDLYLSACAATFHNGIIDLHQILASKGVNNNIPMVRWY